MRLFELESALRACDTRRHHAGANGPGVSRRSRASSAVPVLFVTGHDFDVLAGVPVGRTWSVLRKPFNADDVSAAIAKLV